MVDHQGLERTNAIATISANEFNIYIPTIIGILAYEIAWEDRTDFQTAVTGIVQNERKSRKGMLFDTDYSQHEDFNHWLDVGKYMAERGAKI